LPTMPSLQHRFWPELPHSCDDVSGCSLVYPGSSWVDGRDVRAGNRGPQELQLHVRYDQLPA
jgi:hypothetical protein